MIVHREDNRYQQKNHSMWYLIKKSTGYLVLLWFILIPSDWYGFLPWL